MLYASRFLARKIGRAAPVVKRDKEPAASLMRLVGDSLTIESRDDARDQFAAKQ